MTAAELAELIRLTRLYSEKHAHSPNVCAAARKMELVATNVLHRLYFTCKG